jgi:site-specific recombinase XerD
MPSSKKRLPDIALQYVEHKRGLWSYETCQHVYTPLRKLHDWMDENAIELSTLGPENLTSFFENATRRMKRRESATVLRSHIVQYLAWLHEHERVGLDLEDTFPRSFRCSLEKPSPTPVEEFLDLIQSHQAKGTLKGYRLHIRKFLRFLRPRHVELKAIRRKDLEAFFSYLYRKGLSPATRTQVLIYVRVFLRWCHEHAYVDADSEDLIRIVDFPKLPEYLPRPIPPDADRKIQERLHVSTDLYAKGLLLMRSTGIRIGELISLKFECVRRDHNDHAFLKVELGKLHSERLVPIDRQTEDLIESIRKQSFLNYILFNPDVYPDRLLNDPKGRKVSQKYPNDALRAASSGCNTAGPITSHRLRHTYATALLNAGVGMFTLMKLLGHRHFGMTLRYASVTQETIRNEYLAAISKIDQKYVQTFQEKALVLDVPQPLEALPDLAKWLRAQSTMEPDHRSHLLCRRILALQRDIEAVIKK